MNELGLGMVFSAKDLASGVMQRVGKGMLDLEGRSSEVGKKIQANFASFATGMSMFGAGAAGLAMLQPALSSAKQFERAIAEVTTETDEASLSFDGLYDSAIDLAQQYGKMPVEEAKGLYQAIAAGASDAAKANALMGAANKLAIGGVTDITTAIDGLTSALNAYGMTFSEQNINAVSDAFFVGMRDGKTKVAELASQIGRVAPSAKALGISFDEVIASLSAMTGSGLKTDMAVTGLHGALANIVKPSSDAAAEAQKLGIKFTQAELRAKGWKGFLDQITNSAKFNKDSLSKLFGSVEGLNAIQALTANGSAKFNSILDDMKKKAGMTQNAFDKMADTLEFSEDRFGALVEVSKILIGDALIPAAKRVMQFGSMVVEAFNKIPTSVRNFMVHAFAAASILLTVVGGLIAAKAAIAMFAYGMAAVGVSVGGVVATVAPALLILGALVGMFYAVKYAVDHNMGGIADKVADLYSKLVLFKDAVIQLFTDGGFSGAVLDAFGDESLAPIVNAAIRIYVIYNRLAEFASAFVDGIKEGFDGMGPTVDRLMKAFERLGTTLGFITEDIDVGQNADAFERWGQIGFKAGELIAGAIDWIMNALAGAMEFVGGFADNWDAVSAAGAEFVPIFQDVGDMVMSVLADLGLLDDGTGKSVGGWRAFGHAVASIVGGILHVVSFVFRAVMDQMGGVVTYLSGAVDVIAGLMTGDFSRVWRGVKKEISGVLQVVLATFGPMVEIVATALDKLAGLVGIDLGLGDKVHNLRESMKGTLKDWAEFGGGAQAVGKSVVQPGVAMPGETMPQELIDFYAMPKQAPGETMPPELVDFYAMPKPTDMGYTAATAPAVAVQQAAQDARAQVDVEGLNSAIVGLKGAKEGGTQLTAVMTVDAEVLGRVVAKGQASANASGGGVTPVQVQ